MCVFLSTGTTVLTQVRFWITPDSSDGQRKIQIHTSGFSRAKTFGFELNVDTVLVPSAVLNKATIRFMSFEVVNTYVQRTRGSIRFFVFSRFNDPLLSHEGGEIITITLPSDMNSVNIYGFKFSKWKQLLINEFFEPAPTSLSPISEVESDNSVSKFIIFPNPFNDYFNIRSDEYLRECKVTLYDVLGRTVLKKKTLDSVLHGVDDFIDSKKLVQGVYFLRIQSTDIYGNKNTETKKLLKIK